MSLNAWIVRIFSLVTLYEIGLQGFEISYLHKACYFVCLGLMVWDAFSRTAVSERALFWGSGLSLLISSWSKLPVITNHAYLLSLVWIFVVLGANLKITLKISLFSIYFWAFFHKLNLDYFEPSSSCAVSIWNDEIMKRIAPFLRFEDVDLKKVLIYVSLAIEGLLIFLPFKTRLQKYFLFLGIIFHFVLAFRFPMISLSMTLLYMSLVPANSYASRIEKFWSPVVLLLLIPITMRNSWNFFGDLFLAGAWITPFIYLYLSYHLCVRSVSFLKNDSFNSVKIKLWQYVFFLILTISALMPYLGLKSLQSFSMYSNLRVEGGVSNHLFMQQWNLSDGLRDLSFVKETNHPYLMVSRGHDPIFPTTYIERLINESSRYYAITEDVLSKNKQKYLGDSAEDSLLERKLLGMRYVSPGKCVW